MLLTPQLLQINAFDPSYEQEFKFLYDGNQIVKNRLIITDNDNGNVIYDNIQNALKSSHFLSSNILTSGCKYIAQVQVFDSDGNSSELSEQILFYCHSTPFFGLTGISQNEIIHRAELTVKLEYEQTEGESLKEFQFYLYNSDMSLHTYSNVLYSNSLLEYTFYNLKNECNYYIKAVGKTLNGMSLDTGLIPFNVNYVMIPANVIFKVENNYKNGYITLFSGIIDIGYDLENNNYILKNGTLQLWDNKLTYKEGFTLGSNFALQVEAKLLPLNHPFLLLNNSITLSIKKLFDRYFCCMDGLDEAVQCVELPESRITDSENYMLTISSGDVLELLNTEYEDDEWMIFEIKRVNGIYGLSVYYKSDVYGKYIE